MAQGSAEVEVDVDFFVYLDHEGAGIFEAPLDVGDDEGADGADLFAVDLDLHGHVDLMRRTDESEEAVDLEGGVAGGIEGSGETGWREGDGFEAGGFELVFGHAVVSDGVAALSAEGVDYDGAGGLTGSGIEVDVSLLDVEGSVNGVHGVGEGEVDFAAVGVEGELVLGVLRVEDSGASDDEEEEGVAEEVLRRGEAG